MNYLPQSKHGDCTQCPSRSVPCVKVGKELVCITCNNKNKAKKQIDKAKKRNALRNDSGKIRSLLTSPQNKSNASKSELLQQADTVFSNFIKNRDSSGGSLICPGCRKPFRLDAIDKNGKKIVQCLHFIDRGVYSLRFDEDNAHAGCAYCNLDMFLNKKGKAWKNYREFLVNKLGQAVVEEMELAHRKINMIETQQLKNIIEHYEML